MKEVKRPWRPAWMDDEEAAREKAVEEWEPIFTEWELEDALRAHGQEDK